MVPVVAIAVMAGEESGQLAKRRFCTGHAMTTKKATTTMTSDRTTGNLSLSDRPLMMQGRCQFAF